MHNSEFTPIGEFSENLDGNGYVIKNLNINLTVNTKGVTHGFFNKLTAASTVKNLGIVNAVIKTTHTATTDWWPLQIGIFVGSNSGNISNCYVENSSFYLSMAADGSYLGSFCGMNEYITGVIENCYAVNCNLEIDEVTYKDGVHVCSLFVGQNSHTVKNCFCAVKINPIEKAKKNYSGFIFNYNNDPAHSNNPNNKIDFSNIYYDNTVFNASQSDGTFNPEAKTGAKTTSEMTGENALKNMQLPDAFRVTSNYPVLKIFDGKISSINFPDNQTEYELNSGTVINDLIVNVNLSKRLSPNTKIALYLDKNTEPIIEPSISSQFTISKDELNSLEIGTHTIKAAILDDLSNQINLSSENLTLNIKQAPYPEVKSIKIEPSTHSQSKASALDNVKVTLTGENFSAAYKINLVFKNKTNSKETILECGKFNGANNFQTIDITSENLEKIKSLEKGKYTVQAVIEK